MKSEAEGAVMTRACMSLLSAHTVVVQGKSGRTTLLLIQWLLSTSRMLVGFRESVYV